MVMDPKTGVILLGHGSRVPDAGKNMEKVAAALKERYGYAIVEVCYLSRLGPHFPEAFEQCIAGGAREIIVIPYFLHDGLHLVLDIPEMMQEVAAKHPQVRVVLGAISANSVSSRPGVARMSRIKVLQNTMLPAPMIATFAMSASL